MEATLYQNLKNLSIKANKTVKVNIILMEHLLSYGFDTKHFNVIIILFNTHETSAFGRISLALRGSGATGARLRRR